MDNIEEAISHIAAYGVAVEPIRVDEFTGKRFTFFADPEKSPAAIAISGVILAIIAVALIRVPLKNAGAPDAPAPPSAAV